MCSVQVRSWRARRSGGEQGRLRLVLRLQPRRLLPVRRRHRPAPRRRRHPLLHLRRARALRRRHEARSQGRGRRTHHRPQRCRSVAGAGDDAPSSCCRAIGSLASVFQLCFFSWYCVTGWARLGRCHGWSHGLLESTCLGLLFC